MTTRYVIRERRRGNYTGGLYDVLTTCSRTGRKSCIQLMARDRDAALAEFRSDAREYRWPASDSVSWKLVTA